MVEPLKRRPGASSPPPSRPAPAGRPGSSGARPAPRAPIPPKLQPAASASPDAGKKKVLLFSVAGGVSLLLIVLAAVLMSGPDKTRKVDREETVAPPPVKPVSLAPKLKSPSPADSKPADVDDDFKKAIQDSKKVMGEISKKTVDRERKEREDKAKEDAEKEAEKKAAEAKEKDRDREALAGYDRRKRERREESVRQLEQAKKAVEDDRKSEIARQKALVEKLKNLKLTIKTKGGLILQNVTVLGVTRDELRLAFTYEGAQAEQAFPIDFIEDRSYVDLLKAIHKGDGASGSYELGRHLVLRKLWKDAQTAFEDCVKQDASYQPRVPDLSRILHNEAAFRGSARKIGSDQLFITYDFLRRRPGAGLHALPAARPDRRRGRRAQAGLSRDGVVEPERRGLRARPRS